MFDPWRLPPTPTQTILHVHPLLFPSPHKVKIRFLHPTLYPTLYCTTLQYIGCAYGILIRMPEDITATLLENHATRDINPPYSTEDIRAAEKELSRVHQERSAVEYSQQFNKIIAPLRWKRLERPVADGLLL